MLGEGTYGDYLIRRQDFAVGQIALHHELARLARNAAVGFLKGQQISCVGLDAVDDSVAKLMPQWWDEDQRAPQKLAALCEATGAHTVIFVELLTQRLYKDYGSLGFILGPDDKEVAAGRIEVTGQDGGTQYVACFYSVLGHKSPDIRTAARIDDPKRQAEYTQMWRKSHAEALQQVYLDAARAGGEDPAKLELLCVQPYVASLGEALAAWLALPAGQCPTCRIAAEPKHQLNGGWVGAEPTAQVKLEPPPPADVLAKQVFHIPAMSWPWFPRIALGTPEVAVVPPLPSKVGVVCAEKATRDAVVKSLGRAGHFTAVAIDAPRAPGAGSARWLMFMSPSAASQRSTEALRALAKAKGVGALIYLEPHGYDYVTESWSVHSYYTDTARFVDANSERSATFLVSGTPGTIATLVLGAAGPGDEAKPKQ